MRVRGYFYLTLYTDQNIELTAICIVSARASRHIYLKIILRLNGFLSKTVKDNILPRKEISLSHNMIIRNYFTDITSYD